MQPPLTSLTTVAPPAERPADGGAVRPIGAAVFCHDILLVEDDAALRSVLRECLHYAGYTVHEAANGRAALRYLADHQVRLILTDIFMPETDGLELLTNVRLLEPRPPIIAMSGGMTGDLQLFLKIARYLGAEHTLTKPFTLKELLGAVQAAIGAPR